MEITNGQVLENFNNLKEFAQSWESVGFERGKREAYQNYSAILSILINKYCDGKLEISNLEIAQNEDNDIMCTSDIATLTRVYRTKRNERKN